jgi:hypothetical protein
MAGRRFCMGDKVIVLVVNTSMFIPVGKNISAKGRFSPGSASAITGSYAEC